MLQLPPAYRAGALLIELRPHSTPRERPRSESNRHLLVFSEAPSPDRLRGQSWRVGSRHGHRQLFGCQRSLNQSWFGEQGSNLHRRIQRPPAYQLANPRANPLPSHKPPASRASDMPSRTQFHKNREIQRRTGEHERRPDHRVPSSSFLFVPRGGLEPPSPDSESGGLPRDRPGNDFFYFLTWIAEDLSQENLAPELA